MTVKEKLPAASQRASRAADQPPVAERVTAGLTAKGSNALREIATLEQVNKTDAINRALRVYAHLLSKIEQGNEIVVRNPGTGVSEVIQFL